MSFPYVYVQCPCTETSDGENPTTSWPDWYLPTAGKPASEDGEEEEEQTFNPRSTRANFSLYPPEHLLYCEECQQIRCPRCIIEEIVCWYCPSCLFEMPMTMVRSEGGRCPRNCFNCPICTAPLSINSLNSDTSTRSVTGPFILSCGYCSWSSLDIGWQFEKLSNIQAQMAKLSMDSMPSPDTSDDTDKTFKQLKAFYSSQLASSNDTLDPLLTPSGGLNYSSPASLQRILSIYGGKSSYGKKDSKNEMMRESLEASEGLRLVQPEREAQIIARMRDEGLDSIASSVQRSQQIHSTRFVSDLQPIPTLLRTKRNKRCRTCRHILVKPEPKVQNTRFRIRLLAKNYIPTISLTPLQPSPSLHLPSTSLQSLLTQKPVQLLLTLRNPLFDPVKITLGTPTHTPGKHAHRVTVLCPSFRIGANVDQWDEALGDTANKNRRSSRMIPGAFARPEYTGVGGEGGKVAEAGKIWDKGRNWTSVVVEVLCQDVGVDRGQRGLKPEVKETGEGIEKGVEGMKVTGEYEEDEDVLEIPIFIRMEWENDAVVNGKDGLKVGESTDKRELTFWTVVGVGRISTRAAGLASETISK